MEKIDIGEKLIEVRHKKGLTQKEVAEKSGVTERTIQRIESGRVIPRSYTVKLISKALDFAFFESDITPTKKELSIQPKSKNNYLSNTHYKNIFLMKSRKMKTVIPLGILAIAVGITLFMISENPNSTSQLENHSQNVSKTKDRIEVTFTNDLTKDSLLMIQSDLSSKGISLDYNELEFDEKGQLQAIDCEVDCNDGFQGSFATHNLTSLTKSGQFGFYRDYSANAKSRFGTGTL